MRAPAADELQEPAGISETVDLIVAFRHRLGLPACPEQPN